MNKFIRILWWSVYFVCFLITILKINKIGSTWDYSISEIGINILVAILTLSLSIYYYKE